MWKKLCQQAKQKKNVLASPQTPTTGLLKSGDQTSVLETPFISNLPKKQEGAPYAPDSVGEVKTVDSAIPSIDINEGMTGGKYDLSQLYGQQPIDEKLPPSQGFTKAIQSAEFSKSLEVKDFVIPQIQKQPVNKIDKLASDIWDNEDKIQKEHLQLEQVYNQQRSELQNYEVQLNDSTITDDVKQLLLPEYEKLFANTKQNELLFDKQNVALNKLNESKKLITEAANIQQAVFANEEDNAATTLAKGFFNAIVPATIKGIGAISVLTGEVQKAPLLNIVGNWLVEMGEDAELDIAPEAKGSMFDGFTIDKAAHTLGSGIGSIISMLAPAGLVGKAGRAAKVATSWASSGSQTLGQVYSEAKNIKLEDGSTLSDGQASTIALLTALPVGAIDAISGQAFLPGKLVMKEFVKEVTKGLAGKKITKEILAESVKRSLPQLLKEVGKDVTGEVVGEMTQEGIAIGVEMAADKVLGEKFYGTGLDMKSLKRVADAGLSAVMVSGAMSTLNMVTGSATERKKSLYKKAIELSGNPEKALHFSEMLDLQLKNKVITQEEFDNIKTNLASIIETDAKIPPSITSQEKRLEAINLISERNRLTKENEQEVEAMKGYDETLVAPQKAKIAENEKAIAKINSDLELIAKGEERKQVDIKVAQQEIESERLAKLRDVFNYEFHEESLKSEHKWKVDMAKDFLADPKADFEFHIKNAKENLKNNPDNKIAESVLEENTKNLNRWNEINAEYDAKVALLVTPVEEIKIAKPEVVAPVAPVLTYGTIEKDNEFKETGLTPEQKAELKRMGIAPIKQAHVSDKYYKGVRLTEKEATEAHKTFSDWAVYIEKSKFKNFLNNIKGFIGAFRGIDARIEISTKELNERLGKETNWFGVSYFTTPSVKRAVNYAESGQVIEYTIKKEKPVIITRQDALEIFKNRLGHLLSEEGLNQMLINEKKTLIDLGIDGIWYESDANAVAWVSPETILDVRQIFKNDENLGLVLTYINENVENGTITEEQAKQFIESNREGEELDETISTLNDKAENAKTDKERQQVINAVESLLAQQPAIPEAAVKIEGEQLKPITDAEEANQAEILKGEADVLKDENGKPITLYHGTSKGLKATDLKQSKQAGDYGAGIYFATDKREAEQRNPENVIEANVESPKHLVVGSKEYFDGIYKDLEKRYGSVIPQYAIGEAAKKAGYTSIEVERPEGKWVIVFDGAKIVEAVTKPVVVKPIRQLGTGSNVYFESEKYRVNDSKDGKVYLNVGNKNDTTPLKSIEFDSAEEAVFVAKKLQEVAPEGLVSDFHNVDKIIENYKKEFKAEVKQPTDITKQPKAEAGMVEVGGKLIDGDKLNEIQDRITKGLPLNSKEVAEKKMFEDLGWKFNEAKETKQLAPGAPVAVTPIAEAPVQEQRNKFAEANPERIEELLAKATDEKHLNELIDKEIKKEAQPQLNFNINERQDIIDKLPEENNIEQEPNVAGIEGKAESDSKKQRDGAIEESAKIIADNSATGVTTKPLAELKTELAQMQGRKEPYERESVMDVISNFTKAAFDPIRWWKNEKGEHIVLAGHSRKEGLTILTKLTKGEALTPEQESIIQSAENLYGKIREQMLIDAEAQGFKAGVVPKAEEFKGTRPQAKTFAENSNAKARAQKPTANARIIKREREAGATSKQIERRLTELAAKGDRGYTENLSYLNENGKAITTLDGLDKGAEGVKQENKETIRTAANKAGELRKKYPELTNAHEDEIFNEIMEKKLSASDVSVRVSAKMNSVEFPFEKDKPLNIKEIVSTTDAERAYKEKERDLNTQISDLKRLLTKNQKTGNTGLKTDMLDQFVAEGKTWEEAKAKFESKEMQKIYEDKLQKAKGDLDLIQDRLAEHQISKGKMMEELKNIIRMFDEPAEQYGTPSPEKVEHTKQVKQAQEEVINAKKAIEAKAKELDKEIVADREDLFGERKSTNPSSLFDERVDLSEREKVLAPLRKRLDDANRNLQKLVSLQIESTGTLFEPNEANKKHKKTYTTKTGEKIPFQSVASADNGIRADDLRGQAIPPPPTYDYRLSENEMCWMERQLSRIKHISFSGAERIKSSADVAYLFRHLESAASENVFAVLIDANGKHNILYLSTGGTTGSIVDAKMIYAAAKQFKATSITLVHNHPSGALKASNADFAIHRQLIDMFLPSGINVNNSVIINLATGKYVEFSHSDETIKTKGEAPKKEKKSKVYSFDTQKLFIPSTEERTKVTTSRDVAEFLSKYKSGNTGKLGIIILDRANNINRFLLEDVNISNDALYDKIMENIGKSGESAILTTNGAFNSEKLKTINDQLKKSGHRIIDAVEIKDSELIVNNYKSWADETSLLMEPDAEYGKGESVYEKALRRVREKAEARAKEPTGLKHADTATLREKLAMEEYQRGESVSNEQAIKKAKQFIKEGGDVLAIIDKIKKNIIIDKFETSVVVEYKNSLDANYEKTQDPKILAEIEDLIEASDKYGSALGKGLQARQIILPAVDNLANFLLDRKNDRGYEPTKEQRAEDTKEYLDLKQKFDEYKKSAEADAEQHAKDIAELGVNKARAKAKLANKKSHDIYVQERANAVNGAKEALKKLREAGTPKSTIPFAAQLNEIRTIAPFVKDYVKTLVDETTDNLDSIITQAYAEFKDIVDGLSKKDLIDIVAGLHDEVKQTKPQKLNAMLLLKREAELLNKIADAREGIVKEKNPAQKTVKTDRIIELEKELREVKKQNKLDEAALDEALIDKGLREKKFKTDEEKDLARQKQLQAKINQLKTDIRDKNYAKEVEPIVPFKQSRKTQDLNDDVIALKKAISIKKMNDNLAKMGTLGKIAKVGNEILNLRRVVQIAFDISTLGRQLAPVTFNIRHIAITAKTIPAAIKSFTNLAYFERLMDNIHKDADYHDMVEDGIKYNDLNTGTEAGRNEDYPKSFVYSIPVLKHAFLGSNRAADAPLNIARFELYKKYAKILRSKGIFRETHPQDYKDMAKHAMAMTGRGELLQILENNRVGKITAASFYGPRLIASRFKLLNPANYLSASDMARFASKANVTVFGKNMGLKWLDNNIQAHTTKAVRTEAIKDMVGMTSTVMVTAITLIALGATVSLDPDDGDFLQVRFGGKVYDLTGGLAAYIRTSLRIMMAVNESLFGNKYKGKEDMKKAWASTTRFFRNKLAPNTSSALNAAWGENTLGEDFEPTELLEIYPMYADDFIKAMEEDGLSSIATVLAPNLLGIGFGAWGGKANRDIDIREAKEKKRKLLIDPEHRQYLRDKEKEKRKRERTN